MVMFASNYEVSLSHETNKIDAAEDQEQLHSKNTSVIVTHVRVVLVSAMQCTTLHAETHLVLHEMMRRAILHVAC